MFLVVFRNRKRADYPAEAYAAAAERMEAMARAQPGFRSFKSYVAEDGEVVAISEWDSEDAARAWGRVPDHAAEQTMGRTTYYQSYTLFASAEPRIRKFERDEA